MSYQKEIETYVNNGTYDYEVDSYGNFIIDANNPTFNSEYISFSLKDFVYNSQKIEQLNNVTFQEFMPTIKSNSSISVNINNIFNQDTGSNTQSQVSTLEITPENASEIQYLIQKLQFERDDANKKLNDIISRLEPQ